MPDISKTLGRLCNFFDASADHLRSVSSSSSKVSQFMMSGANPDARKQRSYNRLSSRPTSDLRFSDFIRHGNNALTLANYAGRSGMYSGNKTGKLTLATSGILNGRLARRQYLAAQDGRISGTTFAQAPYHLWGLYKSFQKSNKVVR